ncbi:MAG TPA: hypothetical protein VGH16_08770 [Candidatus Binatia bacterium]
MRRTPGFIASRRTAHCSLLLAWVLLVPPSGAPHNISLADKLRMWTEAAEADTQAECEERREQLKLASAMGRAAEAVERFSQGICVERTKVDAARR